MRTILATIGLILATALLLYIVMQIRQVLIWIVVGGLLRRRALPGGRLGAAPAPRWPTPVAGHAAGLPRRLPPPRRPVTVFAVPLATEGTKFAGQLPELIDDARAGRGPIGDLLERTNALQCVQDNQDRISSFATGLTTPAAGVLRGVATGIAGAVTVFVLSYLMVLEGPKIVEGSLDLFSPRTAERIRRVGARLREVRDRLHLRQPAHQRHLRRAHLRRAQSSASRSPG